MKKATVKLGNITVPANLQGKDLLKFLVENKALLIAEKKAQKKALDEGLPVMVDIGKRYMIDKTGNLVKAAANAEPASSAVETVICVINTTNLMDSHSDVHIPGIWKKSLKDNNVLLHLQEHEMSFAAIISDEAKGYTQTLTWKELGYNIPGTTEALIFATPLKGRNPYMEEQYRNGYVKQHSVGMRYVDIKLCINEPEDRYYKEEYDNWEKYAPQVVNIEDAEAQGYFWAVTEAKVIEGSAVVKGSNYITPFLGYKSAEPSEDTQPKQPASSTAGKDEKPGDRNSKSVNMDKLASINFF